MKKLLFILSAILVSVITLAQDNNTTGLAYTLNPYAYDLKIKQWDESSQTLTVQFKLNAPPNLNGGDYNSADALEPNGIQIYAIDPEGNRYRIGGPGRGDIKTAHVNNNGQYEYTMNLSAGKSVGGANPGVDIPKNVPLTWEVQVKGRNSAATKGRKSPELVFTDITTTASTRYPRAAHGIAIGKDPLSSNFGKIFVADACTTTIAGFTGDNHSALLIYNPLLQFTDYELKSKLYHTKTDANGTELPLDWYDSWFSATTNYEPHRVCVSDDGRVFVSCYHPDAEDMVVELVGNDQFKSIIDADKNGNKDKSSAPVAIGAEKYNRRVIAIDTKNSGDELTLLVAYFNPKAKLITSTGAATNSTSNSYWLAQVECYEYKIGKTKFNLEQSDGELVAVFTDRQRSDASTSSDYVYRHSGLLFMACYGNWNARIHGFVDVVYDDDGDIWMKVDYGQGTDNPARICLFKQGGATSPDYTYDMPKHTTSSYYGANGILVTGNTLITGQSSNLLEMYTIDSNKKLTNMKSYSTVSGTSRGTKQWVTSIAEDFAGNIYALSEEADNIVVVAMPYNGVCRTPSPTGSNFTLSDPIPNILATDLRFAPDGNSDRYVFSFNVNTTPKVAQIRFYKSYGDNGDNDMKKNLATINADDYQGGNAITPSFVYDIPADQLKQGKISVSLGMCGGTIEDGKITNGKLPRGEWYWSVYVEAPRKSSVFAPIYKQGTTGEDAHYRLHATVNNYPETDGFGHIYAAQYNGTTGKKSLMVYNFNANGNSIDNQANISNSTRYKLLNEYVNHTGSKPKFENQRRLAVAPDGKVYISDHGLTDRTQYSTQAWADRPMLFTNGGIWVWDPKSQTEDYVQISMFLNDKTESSSGLAIYDHGNQVKLYGMNTYGEFADHTGGYKWKGLEYTEANQASTSVYGWNGFKEYNLGTKENILYQETAGTTLHPLGMGDGNGNISIVAMDKGVWMAQHRMNDVQYTIDVFKDNNSKKPALPDNTENYILSFVPYGSNTRTWRSCTTRGIDYNGSTFTQTTASELTQLTTSPLQSCPGAGLAYRKTTTGKESLYIVNHQGDIVELQITSWSSTTPSVKYIKTWPGSGAKGQNDGKRTQGFITTMNFDYAGNLITTSGAGYTDNSQDIIVYTMPYDRVNAREIQAPNSCRYIPERVSHLNMGDEELSNIISENQGNTCHVDIFRPMFNTSFSTICLPFDVDLSQASANEYKDAKLMKFAEAVITDINKEKMLELRFTEITDGKLEAGIPYLIQPQEPITQIVHLAQLVSFKSITPEDQKLNFTDGDQNNSITFRGIIPYQQIEVEDKPWPLIVVDNNRLAEVSTTGYINGFRAYFQLKNELAPGTKVGISARKPTPTNVITIDGKRVNIEKFLREGRVYIRVGDSLYTITGEKVE